MLEGSRSNAEYVTVSRTVNVLSSTFSCVTYACQGTSEIGLSNILKVNLLADEE
jgi:hypothetical protein